MASGPSKGTTALERALTGTDGTARTTPIDALRAARRHWLAGERLDMGALAEELEISRATLYTWVGSRERLIGEILWSFAEQGLRQAREKAKGTGADYVVDVFRRFINLNAGFAPLRRFVEQDPELALRVLTSKNSPVQGRMIAASRELLAAEMARGTLQPALGIDTLAYTLIRVAESFLYRDVIAGSEPDVERAVEVVRVLLYAQPPPAPRPKRRGSTRAR
ncbi:MAG TPA: QsdR family transcriptional regulator [Candidatus Binatia bacterium]|jgi:AcrR family transcriptional regulator